MYLTHFVFLITFQVFLPDEEEEVSQVVDLWRWLGPALPPAAECPLQVEDTVKLFISELAMAWDYLQSQRIIHRSVKSKGSLKAECRPEDANLLRSTGPYGT